MSTILCRLERPAAGGTRCQVCGWTIAQNIPLDARKVCRLAGDAPACPVTSRPCDRLRLNQVAHYCASDLKNIAGDCSPEKRARAVAMLAERVGQSQGCPHGRAFREK